MIWWTEKSKGCALCPLFSSLHSKCERPFSLSITLSIIDRRFLSLSLSLSLSPFCSLVSSLSFARLLLSLFSSSRLMVWWTQPSVAMCPMQLNWLQDGCPRPLLMWPVACGNVHWAAISDYQCDQRRLSQSEVSVPICKRIACQVVHCQC